MSSGFMEETCHSFVCFSEGKQAVSWDDGFSLDQVFGFLRFWTGGWFWFGLIFVRWVDRFWLYLCGAV